MFVPRTVSVSKKSSNVKSSKNTAAKAKNEEGRLKEDLLNEIMPLAFDEVTACTARKESENIGTTTSACFAEGDVKAESSDEDEPEVIENSKDQRPANIDEPVCIMCGRYGAYICDRTEKDVCSLECKRQNLGKSVTERLAICDDILNVDNSSASSFTYPTVISTSEEQEFDFHGKEPTSFCAYFDKNYHYTDHPVIQTLAEEKLDFLRKKLEIKTKGDGVARLGLEFKHFDLPSQLAKNLSENGYLTPTSVQMQAIPIGLSKRDMMACAETGTGKSASFLIPIITRISATTNLLLPKSYAYKMPLGLIIGPTRELCMQIEEQAKIFSKGIKNLRTALLIGGTPLPQQLHRLKQGIQIIIATPGRLNEILEKHADACHLGLVQILALDEVDTMLKMGFQAQVDRILQNIPRSSQKLLFSATIPPSIEAIASELLDRPIFVAVGPPSAPNRSVKQIILWVEERSKKKRLFDLLNDKKHFIPPVLIFVDSKIGADMLADAINKVCGISCASLHGDKLQTNRTQILQDFQNGSYQALVSTAVLGRGIDLFNVLMVVNFDMPLTVNEYIHQVGRAGRLDTKGFAISFINNNNKDLFLNLTELFEGNDAALPAELMNSPYLQQQREKRGRNRRKRKDELVTTGNLMDLLKEYEVKKRK